MPGLNLIPRPSGSTFAPGEVAYLLEVFEGDSKVSSVEVPLVASYSVEESPSVTIDHTFGQPWRDILAARDETGKIVQGYRERRLQLSGSSGHEHRLGYDEAGDRLFAGGFDLFMAFRRYLEGYSQRFASWKAANAEVPPNERSGEPRLIFRALREGEEYAVEVTSLTPSLAGIGQLWSYGLTLRAYGPPPPRKLSWLESLLGTVSGAIDTATKFVDAMGAWVAYSAEVTGAVTTTAQQIIEPIRAIGRLAEQVTALAQAGRPIADLPSQIVEAVFQVADQGVEACAQFAAAVTFGALDDETDAFRRDAAGKLNEARMVSLQFLGMRRSTLSAGSSPNLPPGLLGSTATTGAPRVIGYTLGDGESVGSVLLGTYGNLDKLGDVLALNGMADPFTLADGSPVRTGAQFLIPAPLDGVSPVADGVDLFGTDLLLSLDGDFVTAGDEPTDWLTVSGQASLDQGLRIRVLTSRGDFAPFPGFGLAVRVGDSDVAFATALLASDTREQIARDPRVLKVGPVSISEPDGDTVMQNVSYTPIAGPSTTLAAPVT